jgi:hypothetical protein
MIDNWQVLARRSGRSPSRKSPGLALALILLVCTVGMAAAAPAAPAVPESGHAFYGQARTIAGTSLPAGVPIIARTTSGSWTGSVSCLSAGGGLYGYSPTLLVPADDPDTTAIEGAKDGDAVAFFIRGYRARIWDPAARIWRDTYPFKSGGLTQLDVYGRATIYLPLMLR